jgi:hypothetical protein
MKLPIAKLDLFTLQCHHPFQEHHFGSCKTDYNHVIPFGFGKEIAQSPTEIDTSITVGWLHTISLNAERKENIAEEKIGRDRNRDDPDQEPKRQRGEKELPHLSLGARILQNPASSFPANNTGFKPLQEKWRSRLLDT